MDNQYSTSSFEDLHEKLDDAIGWIETLGVRATPSRLGHYRRSLERLNRIYRQEDLELKDDEFVDYVTTLFEAQDLVQIHQSLGGKSHDDHLRGIVQSITGGPTSYTDEDCSSGNRPRNLAFELLLAGRLVSAGLGLDLDVRSDVATKIDNRTVLFECKRPQSERSLEKRTKAAFRQLRRQYSNPVRSRSRGVVAGLTVPVFDI